ncbi:MAG: DUF3151 family protein [Actinomycetes bacterium]
MADLPIADRVDVVLDEPPADAAERLEAALALDGDDRRAAAGDVVADHPTFLLGWAALAALGREPIERYAYARVGYHRGLDAIRGKGWGGSGKVRWVHPTNRGFLRCLAALRDTAAEIGETEEVTRIDEFLSFLDADWDDANLTA